MASAAPSVDAVGDEKPPESAPSNLTSLDPPADPKRNGEPPAPVPSSGDEDRLAMGMTEIPDQARAECGAKRPLLSRPVPCRACARRKMILRGIDPGPQCVNELSALPTSPPRPPPVSGMGLPDAMALGTKGSPSASTWCGPCEFRKKIILNRRLRRNSKASAPLPGQPLPFIPIPPPLDDKSRLALEQKLRARAQRGKKRPLSVEEERGYRECDVGKKVMRHKWAGLPRDSAPEVAGFSAAAGGRDLLEKTMLVVQKALRVDDAKLAPPQGAQKPSASAAARVDVLHEKLAQMTKVLTKVLYAGGILQVSTKLLRLLCPNVGSSAAAGGGLDGSDWRLVEEAIDNLLNQTGEGMQDIVKTVLPKVFPKKIFYGLMMACVARYPKLLEDGKGKLTQGTYEQYEKQLDLMVELIMVYDKDPGNFSKIMKLMCKIGECGPLPNEVIDDISPGLDPSNMEQLYTGLLELLHNVGRASPVHTNPSSK